MSFSPRESNQNINFDVNLRSSSTNSAGNQNFSPINSEKKIMSNSHDTRSLNSKNENGSYESNNSSRIQSNSIHYVLKVIILE